MRGDGPGITCLTVKLLSFSPHAWGWTVYLIDRHELVSELFDIFNRNGIRVRGAPFRVKPTAVAFVDAGRGWLVGKREGELRYPSGSIPGFDTWRTDVGVGLDLGIAGMYVAKAVSSSKEPANFFVRIRSRF